MFSKNCSYFLNLVFFVLNIFLQQKKAENQKYSPHFPCSSYFLKEKIVLKNRPLFYFLLKFFFSLQISSKSNVVSLVDKSHKLEKTSENLLKLKEAVLRLT